MTLLSTLGAAAERLAVNGFAVFPLWPRAKNPMTPNGFKDATTDRSRVWEWWSKSPDANVGISIPQGVVVIDVDSVEAMNNLELIGELPDTRSTKTPRGWHVWFRLPDGVRVQPRVGVLHGVDVRAAGSYVVSPPSVNAEGVRWLWDAERDLAEAPQWLLALIATPAEANGSDGPRICHGGLAGVPEGQRDDAIFRYACKLRAQNRDRQEAEVLILAKAANCAPPFPPTESLRKLDQAWKFPAGKRAALEAGMKIWNLRELLNTEFDEPLWFVQRILPEGLTLVVSPAKVGKSFLVGNVAAAVALGGSAVGSIPTRQAGVLYLDLEESEPRAKRRWRNILEGATGALNLDVAFSWPRLHEGGLERLDEVLRARPEIRVVVIDVLSKFWPPDADNGSGNAYHREYKILSEIKEFATKRNLALVLVHHTNRANQTDPLDRVSGTNAMTAVPDVIWILHRERGKGEGTLYVTGRSVEEETFHMKFSPAFGSWALDKPNFEWRTE